MERDLLDRINAARAERGVAALRPQAALIAAARAHSADLAASDLWGHTGSGNSTPFSRAAAAGYRYAHLSENVAAGWSMAETAFASWWHSPAHRRAMLSRRAQEVGIGHVHLEGSDLGHYWTAVFASPAERTTPHARGGMANDEPGWPYPRPTPARSRRRLHRRPSPASPPERVRSRQRRRGTINHQPPTINGLRGSDEGPSRGVGRRSAAVRGPGPGAGGTHGGRALGRRVASVW